MDLGSITLLTVLSTYGDAAQVAAHAEDAAVLMQRTGRAGLERETIERLLASARHTVGLSCIEAERQALRVVAQDMLSTYQALRRVEQSLEGEVQADSTLERMAGGGQDHSRGALLQSGLCTELSRCSELPQERWPQPQGAQQRQLSKGSSRSPSGDLQWRGAIST